MVEGTIGTLLRLSARVSAGFLCAAFFAYAAQLSRNLSLRWFSRKRRWFLALLGISHTAHLTFIFMLWHERGIPPLRSLAPVVVIGGAAYLFIYTAVLDAMGVRFSPRLVNFGLYYVWTIFFIAMAAGAAHSVFHAAAAGVLLSAVILRAQAGRAQPAASTAAAR